ncbi:hypothetical protein VTL71DRAFT_12053 [Oculimacula yallundae]|uniref:BTB domain-containing protein n=1 Tax=Oculimacula yallundae TaxID=86028 RepID=A0ABR4CRY3_9HELO
MVRPNNGWAKAANNDANWEQDTAASIASITPVTPTRSSQVPSNTQMVLAYDQPKMTISQRLGHEVLTLIVGQEPRAESFAVHKNLLRDLGGYFMGVCNESPSGARVLMPIEDPDVIKLLIDYVYSSVLPQIFVHATPNEKAIQLRHLIQFYALADKFELNHEIRNRTMDNLQEAFYLIGKLPEGSLVYSVYERTSPSSRLRKFCAMTMAYQLHDENWVQDGSIASLLNSSGELMVDFLEAVRAYRHREDPRIRHCQGNPLCLECEPNNGEHLAGKQGVHPCCFHIHDQVKGADGNLVDSHCHLWKSE